ncbi:MAG: amidohydrolase family protein [Armatimonadetes bacterium]|nr:amidohydrolase family protein [Armatimonadota bacterium]
MDGHTTVIRGRSLFDGVDTEHREGASVWIEAGRIRAVYGREGPPPPPGARVLDFPDGGILPGFIDTHVHLILGTAHRNHGPKSYNHVMGEDSDALMLLRCVRNGYLHLMKAGVTAMRDVGARNRITLDLKEGLSAGLFHAFPAVQVCGRSITMTGGHFHFCNEEADGPEACRLAVRRLVKEGADFIKVMGSGGGTYITDARRASYTVEELRAIVDEAHRHGKVTTIHCLATQSVVNALDAGFDCIEHYEFQEMDYTRNFNRAIGRRMIDQDVWLSPTIQTGYRRMESLRALRDRRPLTPGEQEALTYFEWKQEGQLYVTGELYRMGARKFIMGTDAIAEFGDYAIGLELLVAAGLPTKDTLRAATSNAAAACGFDDAGMLAPGKAADVVVVRGNPLDDIRATGDVVQVVKGGFVLPMDSLALFPHGPGAAAPPVRRRRPDPQVIRT